MGERVANTGAFDLPPDAAQMAAYYTPTPILLLDPYGTFVYANPAAVKILGITHEHLLDLNFLDSLDEGSRAKGRRLLELAVNGPTEVFELIQCISDERSIAISYRAVPLQNTQRQRGQAALMLFGQPLEQVVSTTEQLLATNQRLNALFALTAGASKSLNLTNLLYQSLDILLRELELQAGAVLLFNTSSTTNLLSSPSIPYLWLAAQRGFEAADEVITADWIEQLISQGKHHGALVVIEGEAEELGLQPHHIPQAVGPFWKAVLIPLQSENEQRGWLLALTDRYRALGDDDLDTLQTVGNLLGPPVSNARVYEELHERTGQLQAVLDGIEGGVLLVDSDGIVRYANQRLGALLLTDVSHWPGKLRDTVLAPHLKPLPQVHPPLDGDLWQNPVDQRVLRRFTDQVTDNVGVLIGSIEVYTDITQIQQLTQLKDEFVAAAAHDLKTPVTAIKGYSQIALRLARKTNEGKLVQQLEMVNSLSDDLTHHMELLLDMSRLQVGRLHLDIDEFKLADVVQKAARHFDLLTQRQQRQLSVDLPTEPIVVAWDRARIERVLINLIGNAFKYSPNGDLVVISARLDTSQEHEPQVQLCVTDYGIGIPDTERERVFERFYRVRQAIDDGFKGTGLGLYICRSIISAHHGSIKAEPAQHGGAGTTIQIVLPQRLSPEAHDD